MSIIDDNKASADIMVVREPAKLWTIRVEDFNAFVAKYPGGGVKLLRAVADDLSRRVRSDGTLLLRQSEENRHRFLDNDYYNTLLVHTLNHSLDPGLVHGTAQVRAFHTIATMSVDTH